MRFEQAIVTSASTEGKPGIILLPGVEDAMRVVRSTLIPSSPPDAHIASSLPPFASCPSPCGASAPPLHGYTQLPRSRQQAFPSPMSLSRRRTSRRANPTRILICWVPKGPVSTLPTVRPLLLPEARCLAHTEAGVVFEDAPSGIRSGKAAGCKTIGLLTSHSWEQVEAAQPDYIVKDMTL